MDMMRSKRATGLRLEGAVRDRMERAFDGDFSPVRIHLGGLADALGVRACACGSDLYFAPDKYRPDDPAGQILLAHELAHVVQQQTGQVANPYGAGVAVILDPTLEAAAHRCAAWAVRDRPVSTSGAIPPCPIVDRIGSAFLLPNADPRWEGPARVVQCDDDDGPTLSENEWPDVATCHPRIGGRVGTTTEQVLSGAKTGTRVVWGVGAAAVGVAAAIGTGGAAVAVGAAASSLGSAVKDGMACYKTMNHIDNLKKLLRDCPRGCRVLNGDGRFQNLHPYLHGVVLPYIIAQKYEKAFKKGASVVGGKAGVGGLVSLYSMGRYLYKTATGKLGVQRNWYAECLAVHLLTADCPLADGIVAELCGRDLMQRMQGESSKRIAPLIAAKMKSV
jgi:hypothetical protein